MSLLAKLFKNKLNVNYIAGFQPYGFPIHKTTLKKERKRRKQTNQKLISVLLRRLYSPPHPGHCNDQITTLTATVLVNY